MPSQDDGCMPSGCSYCWWNHGNGRGKTVMPGTNCLCRSRNVVEHTVGAVRRVRHEYLSFITPNKFMRNWYSRAYCLQHLWTSHTVTFRIDHKERIERWNSHQYYYGGYDWWNMSSYEQSEIPRYILLKQALKFAVV